MTYNVRRIRQIPTPTTSPLVSWGYDMPDTITPKPTTTRMDVLFPAVCAGVLAWAIGMYALLTYIGA